MKSEFNQNYKNISMLNFNPDNLFYSLAHLLEISINKLHYNKLFYAKIFLK